MVVFVPYREEKLDFFYCGLKLAQSFLAPTGSVYHGSSSRFDMFRGSNHFFTSSLFGAYWFANLSGWFRGSPDSTYWVYECTLDTLKVHTPLQKDTSLLSRDGSPSDHACQDFLKENPTYTAIHFLNILDGGTRDVWFVSEPNRISIQTVLPIYEVALGQGEQPPEVAPTVLDFYPGNKYSKFQIPKADKF